MDRIILHCDCNCFYASCELLSHPDLRNLPVAVCGDPTERHGIILAKNEPAKRCGVKTAETIWKAKQKCPGLILLPPHHRLYAEYSKKINAVYGEYTDLVEPFGIDESWLDVTNSLHLFGGDAKVLADTLRGRIKREFGLTISVGVSFNKVFAKLGSDYKKPDATTVIARDNWRDIVFPLPVGDLLFVGRSAQELLVLPETGIADDETWTAVEALSLQLAAEMPNPDRSIGHGPVYPGRAIGAGSVGPDVAQVETWLNGRSCLYCTEGYVTENRCFGPEETAAVRLAQQRAGLLVTGTVDRGTWAALQAQSCPHCSKEE